MKFFNRYKTLALLAEEHHKVPVVTQEKRHLGIILTLVGWLLAAFYTVLFQVSNTSSKINVSANLSNVFLEFTLIHLTMFIFFFVFSMIRGRNFFKAKEPKLLIWRSIFAILSLWFYSLARVWTSTVDNSMLYSIDALCIVVFLAIIGIKVSKISWLGIFIGVFGIFFVYSFDIKSIFDILGGFFGTMSGVTLAIITIITTYLVKQDPPLRIGLYQSALGFISSLIIAIILGIVQGWHPIRLEDIVTMAFSGIFFGMMLFCIWEAFYYTEAYIIGALSYFLPVFVETINWILTREPVKTTTIIGTLIITLGCMIVVFDVYLEDKRKMFRHYGDGRISGK
ncbi:EamA family transporter [Simkania negevensis]|uniref:EamA domain-containing protein n=1 Tax=Simkania negevensis (strain ATCC VR-1471 / DSM 27360 / Z) TaxID=331113 RepID=F8L321_SIMNZ|nr:EamA family transporter [Simkania negevensis]CCB87867.1 hypothetical protein SNE_B25080 [Simkania negevensis Z]